MSVKVHPVTGVYQKTRGKMPNKATAVMKCSECNQLHRVDNANHVCPNCGCGKMESLV